MICTSIDSFNICNDNNFTYFGMTCTSIDRFKHNLNNLKYYSNHLRIYFNSIIHFLSTSSIYLLNLFSMYIEFIF